MMKVQVILSSVREGRLGERVGTWVTTVARERDDFEVELVDLADYDLPHFDEAKSPRFNPDRKPIPEVRKWLDKVGEADAYVIVTPEYNHAYPASLKDALDFLDFQFVKKPVAIVSYGTVGGARAAEQLKLVLIEVKAAVVPEALALMNASAILDPDGTYHADPQNPANPHVVLEKILGELSWWAHALKAARTGHALT